MIDGKYKLIIAVAALKLKGDLELVTNGTNCSGKLSLPLNTKFSWNDGTVNDNITDFTVSHLGIKTKLHITVAENGTIDGTASAGPLKMPLKGQKAG